MRLSVVAVPFLTIEALREYLRDKKAQESIVEDAVFMKRELSSRKIRVVAGFLDGDNGIRDAQACDADEVDPFIGRLGDDEVVIVR